MARLPRLTHFRLCPHSRAVRLALAELGIEVELVEERPWEWRAAFLALNPAGELPVLELTTRDVVCGSYAIAEYLADAYPRHPRDGLAAPCFPGTLEERAEARRLVDWFHGKLDREATRDLMAEKVWPRFQPKLAHTPEPEVLRAIRANLAYHMSYLDFLARTRTWLAGEAMSYADLAAAAHVSCADYLDEVDWSAAPDAKTWYSRMKSRPSLRAVLTDRVPGLAPRFAYADPDF